MHTTPLFIPLSKGLDLSKEATLGSDELHAAENVDYALDGAAKGRPSRSAAVQFVFRTGSSTVTAPAFTQTDFASTGFTAQGLMRLRDASGERAMLGCRGRLFSKEGSLWEDRGHFACARHDRLMTLAVDPDLPPLVSQDFYRDMDDTRTGANGFVLNLLDSDFSAQRSILANNAHKYAGGSARCGNSTASVFQDASTGLFIALRNNGSMSVTEVQIASDCGGDWTAGRAAQICCDSDETHFYVIYTTTDISGDEYKVLRVDTAGTVSATYTGSQSNLRHYWLTNLSVATDKVMVALTDDTGATFKVLTASTMTDAALDSTYAPAGTDGAYTIVVGSESSSRVWFGVVFVSDGTTSQAGGLYIGTVDPGSASSATLVKALYSDADPTWSVVHQPVKCGGRMYMTVSAGWQDPPSTAGTSRRVGTWLTLDLSNVHTGTTNGPFPTFTQVARGEGDTHCLSDDGFASAAAIPAQSAVLLADGSGWTFPTKDWTAFGEANFANSGSQTFGLNPVWNLNRITFSGPRAVQAGGSTIFSGSVPHELSMGGECYAIGFPFCNGIPRVTVSGLDATGNLAAGDYSFVTCWKYTDSSGQVHRSWPSPAQVVTVDGATIKRVECYILNPQLSERPNEQISLELYVTEANPTADSAHYLQTTVAIAPATAQGFPGMTRVVFGASTPDTTTLPLYTDADEFGNLVVPADGGIAALGNRVWLATSNRVYASKLVQPGVGIAWNDEGSLQADLPAGAGRIVSLEGLDDRLLIFCERGVYMVPDGGPNNTGLGPDIATPVRLSELGIAGPRSSCWTDQGVVFCSPLDATDPARGGPWLLDRQLTVTERQYLGRPAIDKFLKTNGWVPEVAYSPERQQVYITTPNATASETGVVMLDLRTGKWSTWSHQSGNGSISSIATVAGVLWTMGLAPAAFDGAPGSDSAGAYTMLIKTAHLASDGQNTLGWSRVKSITALAAEGADAHTLTVAAIQDWTRTSSNGGVAITAATADTTWPTTRQAPQWDLPTQKCSTIQVQLSATPATARWSAIRLDVRPMPLRAPAKNRS